MLKEGQIRIPSGCAIAAVISREGNLMSGEKIIECMKPMHDRSNGLGGGFAAYGIYPEYKDQYALHIFYNNQTCREECERFLKDSFEVVRSENIPTRKIPEITDEPLIWLLRISSCVGARFDATRRKRIRRKDSYYDKHPPKRYVRIFVRKKYGRVQSRWLP